MNIIGFDFGTTNSMLSYYNPETKELDCFTPNAAASSYIPTVIAYKGDDVIIGTLAKNNITKKGYDAYEHFKLRLGRDADKVIENRSKSPLQVTTDYIKKILAQYQDVQNISHIDGIVMTVPETWFREASNRTARENIEGIYAFLGYDTELQFQLESEPVAATAYFCHNYERSAGKKYDGHITVVDYGGGTLDVTLCKVDNGGSIKILERCGFGEFNSTNGCAGIAFDEAVTELLCKRNEMDVEKTDRRFIKLRDLFEKELIDNTETVCSMMVRYYKSPATLKVLFEHEQLDADAMLTKISEYKSLYERLKDTVSETSEILSLYELQMGEDSKIVESMKKYGVKSLASALDDIDRIKRTIEEDIKAYDLILQKVLKGEEGIRAEIERRQGKNV